MVAATRALALRAHIEDRLLPLWLEHGWDERLGLFVEQLDGDFRPLPLGYHRAMVCGRQMFVYARAFARTGIARYGEVAHRLFEALRTRFWDDVHGGWVFSIGADGRLKDGRKDLYAHAFGLFALGQYYGVFKDPAALDLAQRADEVIMARLRQPGGWLSAGAERDWSNGSGELKQNPHMHLLEGYLSLAAATDAQSFRDRAAMMARLCTDRLIDPKIGIIREHFAADGRADAALGNVIEPGHQFEWHWLLHEYADLTGDETMRDVAERLFSWATRHGVDAVRGGIFNQVDPTGAVLEDGKRIWPVGECIKACATRARRSGSANDEAAVNCWSELLQRAYLKDDGSWHEHLDRALAPAKTPLPASTGYHLMTALLEIERTDTGCGVFVFPKV